MTIRFRYRTPDGQEVEVATVGELSERIARGELTEETLVFDAACDGWAPLRSHEVFLTEIAPLASQKGAPPTADPLDLSRMVFTIADADEPSTEDLVSALLRQREDAPAAPWPFGDAGDLAPRPTLVEASAEGPAAEPAAVHAGGESVAASSETAAGVAAPPSAARSVRYASSPRRDGPRPPRPATSRPGPLPPSPERRRGSWRTKGLLGGTLVLALTAVTGVALSDDGRGDVPIARAGVGLASATPSAEGPLPARLTALESEALEDMVLGMDSLRAAFEVERVPPIWLEGAYLAGAGAHPEVRYFWERYRTYVEQVRALESELFRRHVMAQLERGGVSGPMVSIRLARALRVFEAERPRRETVYLSMLELADASLDLHDLLVEHEEDILFEPASAGVSREPVLEAVALDPDVGESMDLMLDRIFEAIERVYGDRVAPRDELAGALARGLSHRGS